MSAASIPRTTSRLARRCSTKIIALNKTVRPYTVRKGDTLYSIASKRALEVKELQSLNVGVDEKKLQPGQTILLPALAYSARDKQILKGIKANGPRVYPVRPGESITEIAANRGIPFEKISELNPNMNLSSLKGGEEILLPEGYYTKREKEMLQGIMPTPTPVLDVNVAAGVGTGLLLVGLLAGAFTSTDVFKSHKIFSIQSQNKP
mmetsp:Transcript_7493/g.26352  ORF Transcript_7493/g.26352 Transcript_7493/m.26352 type:complete len:206 (+) Transcript_7493:65-682(+)|eukprot:CAMPEP_0183794540 /NCGR_PEP_ID=MMETSP0803_2-20130417/3898_1 /TAXON_ID=195967 /ORGANISM="Crustomastix stigmata, Strain CCMP3273" /LENGTH=205 /DNA_ID=CAMNT_0026038945 /DNA_START=42 /DNA_END=659 /DNA_ORIENTATION=+